MRGFVSLVTLVVGVCMLTFVGYTVAQEQQQEELSVEGLRIALVRARASNNRCENDLANSWVAMNKQNKVIEELKVELDKLRGVNKGQSKGENK